MQIIIKDISSIDTFVKNAAHFAPHLAQIAKAAFEKRCQLALVPQEGGPFDLMNDKPFVCIVGDDLDCSMGPAGFDGPSMDKMLKRTAAAAVISCEIIPWIYDRAAALAREGWSTVIVETRPEHEVPWKGLIKSHKGIQLLMAVVRGNDNDPGP